MLGNVSGRWETGCIGRLLSVLDQLMVEEGMVVVGLKGPLMFVVCSCFVE